MVELLGEVSAALASRDIAHALVGAGALAVHGISRSTFDLDLFTTDRAALDPRTWSSLRASGAAIDVRTGDDADPLAGVVRITRPGQRDVDVVVGRPGWQAEVAKRAVRAALGGASVPVATAEDLVLLKLYAGGSQDAWDVDQLLAAAQDEQALREAVEARLAALPREAIELWRAILARRR